MNWHLSTRPLRAVRLLTFDLDDTLWPCFPVIHAAEREVHAWLDQAAPELARRYDIDALREHRQQLARDNPDQAHDLTGLRLRSYRELARRHGVDEAIAEQANVIFRRARNRVTPFEEVVEVLTRLRRHYRLVAVSNGNAQVECTPLADCFDHAFMAEEVGAAKPDPALFHAASQATGIPLEQAAHVGDDPLRDVEAARRAGMHTVWVNREGADWPAELPPPDVQVRDLRQLLDYLLSESGRAAQ
ncbi:MAG: HAD family hydrolase [Gammaproteobacteria bacterium]|nr:MAG: HAD family hydrolase [Gammaproteobacteria bacterium]